MLIDLNNQHFLKEIKYDVCIFGAGPAGITLARTLAAKGKTIALIEGGGLDYSEESQSLYEGKNIGALKEERISSCRLRFFGGTSNHWGGRCALPHKYNFERPDFEGLPGWPVKLDDVLAYLNKALEIIDIPANAFSHPRPPFDSQLFNLDVKALSRPPTHFGVKYLNEIKSSSKIHTYINANLVNINLRENGDSLSGTEVHNYNGGRFVFTSKYFVLALGGIENARILLNSDKQIVNGIGNHSGFVGRCFMDSINLEFGRFVVENQQIMRQGMELNPSVNLMKMHGIGNAVLAFDPHFPTEYYGRLKELKKAVMDAICKSELTTDILRKFNDFDCQGDGVITSMIEQSPNPDSRITLDTEQDRFGLRKVKLDWRLSDEDVKTIRVLGVESAKELARMKIARVQLKDFILDDHLKIPSSAVNPHCHHMGTTRMATNPNFGVVDANCKVHNLSNLYIAGSSVFSSCGGVNPTLTIIMLTLRLGDHIANLV